MTFRNSIHSAPLETAAAFPVVIFIQSLSHVLLFVTQSTTVACQASSSFTISQSLLKFMSIELVIPSNHLILCHPLLLLPLSFPSIKVFSSESALRTRWAKYWSFSFSVSSSNEYSRLISFRMNWFDPLALQGTLSSRVVDTLKNINCLFRQGEGTCL